VAAVLDLVMNQDEPNHVALRRQMPRLTDRFSMSCAAGLVFDDLGRQGVRGAR
jgi:hypothetical protein